MRILNKKKIFLGILDNCVAIFKMMKMKETRKETMNIYTHLRHLLKMNDKHETGL